VLSLVTRIKASPNYKWWATTAMAIGTLITVADTGLVSVALPTIADHFDTDLPTVQWLATGYLVAISALLMPMGRLSDMIGRKRVYLWGLTVFTVASGLAALSSDLGLLIFFRFLQGAGLGMVQGNQMAIMTSIFPPEERGKALGIHMTMVGAALIIGPAIGGVLVDTLGWQSVFYVNLPLGVVCILPGLLVLEESRVTQRVAGCGHEGYDWAGAALSSMALLTFLLGMTNPWKWDPVYRAILLASSALSLGLFVGWEKRTKAPMLDISLFKEAVFSLSVSARSIAFITSSTVLFLIPFYLQGVAGYSPGESGLIMTTVALGMVVVGPLAGRYSDRFGWRRFNVGGAALSAGGLFILSQVDENSALALVMAGIIMQSCGMGMFTAPNTSSILSVVPKERYGVISGFVQLLRTGSNVTGIAIATVIIAATMRSQGFEPNLGSVSEGGDAAVASAFADGLKTVYLVMASIQLVAVALSLVKGGGVRVKSGAAQPAAPG
jgi:EmrB/QacA subfamily drug resistance transporter